MGFITINNELLLIIVFQLGLFTFALLLGYWMGRNSIDKPMASAPIIKPKNQKDPPYHDNEQSMYDEYLEDKGGRISTL